jgi:ASC-1-like (ASCH) protein
LKKVYVEAIINGDKTVESRFTKTRKAPLGQIACGDVVFLKESSGPVRAVARVGKVEEYYDLGCGEVDELKEKFNKYIRGEKPYWIEKKESRYAVLVWLKNVKLIPAITISKKDWRAWVVLTTEKNYGLLENAKIKTGS